jgi:uncharacterized protein
MASSQATVIFRNPTQDLCVTVVENGLRANLSLTPGKAHREIEVREVYDLLHEAHIIHGVKNKIIAELVARVNRHPKSLRDKTIAFGTACIPGKDAQVLYLFKTTREIDLTEDEKGNIDFKQLGIVTNVTKDQLLARIIPSVESQPGTNIFGKTIIPKPVKDITIQCGHHVLLSENRQECYAKYDGQVFLKGIHITVEPLMEIKSDVDLTTGNIDFNGSIVVHGNVLSGFELKALGSITVKGLVEGATLSSKGNIFVGKGIKGADKGILHCEGDLNVGFIESAKVFCEGNLTIETSVVNSEVTTYGIMRILKGKGLIVGGKILAVGGITCFELGSRIGVKTEITIGNKPILREKIEEITKKILPIKFDLRQILKGMEQYQRLFQNLEAVEEQKRKALLAILQNKAKLEAALEDLESKKNELTKEFNSRTYANIKVRRITHPNISLSVGHAFMNIKSEYKHTCFSENEITKAMSITPVR